MAGEDGNLVVRLSAEVDKFAAGMQQAENLVKSTMGNIQSITESALGVAEKAMIGLSAAWSLDKFVGGISGAIQSAAAMNDMALKAGASVEALSGMGLAAKLSGTSMDTVASALGKLSKAELEATQGNEKLATMFRSLGVDVVDKTTGKLRDSGDVMLDLSKKVVQLGDSAKISAAAQELLGKKGAEMLPFMRELAAQGQLTAKLTTEQTAEAKAYESSLALLEARNGGLYKSIAIGITPALTDLNEVMLKNGSAATWLKGVLTDFEKDGSLKRWADNTLDALAGVADFIGNIFVAEMFRLEKMIQSVKSTWDTITSIGGSDSLSSAIDKLGKLFTDGPDVKEEFMQNVVGGNHWQNLLKQVRAEHGSKVDKYMGDGGGGDFDTKPPASGQDRRSEWERYLATLTDQTNKLEQGEFAAMEAHAKRLADWNNAQAKLPKADLSEAYALIHQIQEAKELAYTKSYAESIDKETQALQNQNAMLGMGVLEQQQYAQAQKEAQKLKDSLDAAEKSGLMPSAKAAENDALLMAQRERLINQLTSTTEIATAQQLAAIKDRYDKERTWQFGAQKALQDYAESATNQAANIGSAVGNAFKGMEDTLVSFCKTGKLDFKSLADSIITDMIRIQVRQSITGPLASASKDLFSNAGSGLFSGIGSSVSNAGSSLFSGIGSVLGFASGGNPPVGVPSIVGENGPEWFVPSSTGTILPNGVSPVAVESNKTANITFNVTAMDARSFQTALAQNRTMIVSIIDQALNATGRPGIAQGYAR